MAAARALIDQGVAGVFYYPVELPAENAHYNQLVVDKLLSAGVAVIAVDRDIVSFPERSKLPLVTYDNRRGGYLVANHLIKQGCKRIAFIGSPYVSSAASDRMRGYCDALEDNGLVVDKALIRNANLEDLDATFCKSLIDDLCERGVCRDQATLLVLDGSKALRKAVLAAWGRCAIIQRCQIHKKRNIQAHVPDRHWDEIRRRLNEAYNETGYGHALKILKNTAALLMPLPGMTLIDVELVVRDSTGG